MSIESCLKSACSKVMSYVTQAQIASNEAKEARDSLPAEVSSSDVNIVRDDLELENLDSIVAVGMYRQGSTVNATTAENYPVPLAGQLEVVGASGSQQVQRYTVYNTQDVFTRTYYSSWSEWKLISEKGGFKNKLINGCFRIFQRAGNVNYTSSTFNLDRWRHRSETLTGGSFTISKAFTGGSGYYMLKRYIGATSNGYTTQDIEGKELFGKTITFSAEIYTDNNASTKISFAKAEDDVFSPTVSSEVFEILGGGWRKITFTTTLVTGASSAITDGDFLRLTINEYGANATAIGTNVFRYRNAQLEVGTNATEFEQRPIALEESLCRYYYRRYHTQQNVNDLGYEMRTIPTESGTSPYYYDAEL